MVRVAEGRPLGELFGDLASEIGDLVRQELALAKVEVSDNVSRAGKDLAYVAIGGAVVYAGLLALIATLIVGIALAIGSWLAAAAIVTVVVLAVGYFILQQGLTKLKQHDITPHETLDSLNVNANWAKEQFR